MSKPVQRKALLGAAFADSAAVDDFAAMDDFAELVNLAAAGHAAGLNNVVAPIDNLAAPRRNAATHRHIAAVDHAAGLNNVVAPLENLPAPRVNAGPSAKGLANDSSSLGPTAPRANAVPRGESLTDETRNRDESALAPKAPRVNAGLSSEPVPTKPRAVPPINCSCDDHAPASLWWRIGGSAFLAMNAMVLSIAANGSVEVTAEERYTLELSILCIAFPVFFLLSAELLEAAWRAAKELRLSIELLFLIGIGACLAGSALYFLQRTGNGYADVAAMLLVIYALGRQIGAYGKQRVLNSLTELAPQNRKARLLEPEQRIVPASEIEAGDRIRVLPGESVPVDIRLFEGAALLHESSVTGESLAVRKTQGDLIKAGSFPLDCSIEGDAVSRGSETSLDAVRGLIASGLARPGAEQGMAIGALRWFLPLVLVLSLATFAWHLQSKPWDQAVFTALAVLVIACPCALGFATPLAVWMGIARLREIGVVARSGEAMEKLAEIDTVVFDKTGTLTLPEQYGVTWRVAETWLGRERELAAMLRDAELASRHPLSKILAPLWRDALSPCAGLRNVRLLPGAGIVAQFHDGRELFAGMEDRTSGKLIVTVDREMAASIDLAETQATEVSPAVRALEALGVDVVLATGDAEERAAEIPVKTRLSRQSPEDKQALLRDLSGKGRRVLFAGDGLNDTAAMAWSHVACAAPECAELVRDLSGLVFLHRDWKRLSEAIRIARKVRHVVRWNIVFSLAYNLVGMAVAATGWLHPVASALLMTASSLTVIVYTMHLMDWESA
jgi:heavy metal translocating P-type ATPase